MFLNPFFQMFLKFFITITFIPFSIYLLLTELFPLNCSSFKRIKKMSFFYSKLFINLLLFNDFNILTKYLQNQDQRIFKHILINYNVFRKNNDYLIQSKDRNIITNISS